MKGLVLCDENIFVGLIYVLGACLLWALDTLFRYPLISAGIEATHLVFLEHVFLVVYALWILFDLKEKIFKISLGDYLLFIFIGVMGSAVGTVAFTKAFALVNPSHVILLQKLQPLVAVTLAYFFLREPVTKIFLAWASLGLVGAILVSYRDILGPGLFSIKASSETLMGYGLTLAAVAIWGSCTVAGKKLSSSGYSHRELVAFRFLFGFLGATAFLPKTTAGVFPWDLVVWGKIFIMALLSGAIALNLYYRGLKTLSARACAIAEMFFPLCAIIINWVFLDKTLDEWQLLGGGFLVVSSTVIQLKRY